MAASPPVVRADEPGAARPVDDRFHNQVVPILSKYCFGCHSGDEPKGNLSLGSLKGADTPKDRETWETVLEMLDSRSMPPKNKSQPRDAERRIITDWIRLQLESIDCSGKRNPGRVTLRRLNRVEYNNTIRDLVGVDFQPADDFPTDDVGYGFDNIGDVLTISPILVEKYLSTAEHIAERAIVASPPREAVRRIEAKDLAGGDRLGQRTVVSRAAATTKIPIGKDGSYVIRVKAFAAKVANEPPRLIVRVDDREVTTAAVVGTRDSPRVVEARMELKAGPHTITLADARRQSDEKTASGDEPARPLIVIDFVEIAEQAKLPNSHRRIITVTPSAELASDRCARLILTEFATRAFRRPVAADDIERFVKLVMLVQEKGDTFERGIQLAVEAVLTSPHFLFRVEADPEPGDEDGIRELTDYELATRLSYFLWSTMPDEELFRLARQASLHEPAVLEAQVRRMLKHRNAEALVENFAGQWLQLRDVAKVTPDPEGFPDFDDALRTAMLRETELLFDAIVKEDRSVLEFLNADYTFLNERLARHYGVADVRGDEFRRVALPANQRRGVLTHASILTLTSNPTRTSPVKRGKWILENILGTPPPAPPPGVEELNDDKDAQLAGSLRQRMEQHREKPMCATCHSRMDPLGFAFENFDAIGAWRDFDGKFAVDASGELPSGDKFRGPVELARHLMLAKREQFCGCLTEKMLTYALGRGLEFYDQCTVDDILKRLAKEEYRFSSLVLGIVQSDPFLKRGNKGTDE